MSKFSSFKESKMLFENWRSHINEISDQVAAKLAAMSVEEKEEIERVLDSDDNPEGMNEAHGLSAKDKETLQNFAKGLDGDIKRILDFLISSNIEVDKTQDVTQMSDEEKEKLNEDGHTDVASACRSLKTSIEDAQQMLSVLMKMDQEGDLPSWWMKKSAIASDYLNKMRDYLLY